MKTTTERSVDDRTLRVISFAKQIDVPKHGHTQTATAETKIEKENESHVNI